MQLSINHSVTASNNYYGQKRIRNQSFKSALIPAPILDKTAQNWRMGNSKKQLLWGTTIALTVITGILISLSTIAENISRQL